jgi:biopolymer transport protein ExbB/TolQ
MKFATKLVLVLVILMSVGTLSAKPIGQMYMEGGVFMHIISLLLLIMIAMAIVKYVQLAVREKVDSREFYLKLKGYIRNDQLDEAIKISEQFKKTTIGFIFWSGLLGYRDGRKSSSDKRDIERSVQNAFDESGLQTIPKIEGGLFWFDIIAQVSTLLGLLGTIFGLVAAFDALATAPEAQKSQLLTLGISQAMGTTAYGLIVAIPTMFVKGGLQARADKIINDIDEYSVKIINQISYSMKG